MKRKSKCPRRTFLQHRDNFEGDVIFANENEPREDWARVPGDLMIEIADRAVSRLFAKLPASMLVCLKWPDGGNWDPTAKPLRRGTNSMKMGKCAITFRSDFSGAAFVRVGTRTKVINANALRKAIELCIAGMFKDFFETLPECPWHKMRRS